MLQYALVLSSSLQELVGLAEALLDGGDEGVELLVCQHTDTTKQYKFRSHLPLKKRTRLVVKALSFLAAEIQTDRIRSLYARFL